jgi:hypothetical protein
MRSCILLLIGLPLTGAFTSSRSTFLPRLAVRGQPVGLGMSETQDGEALQTLFAKQCDSDGLMTKDALSQVPSIADLLVRTSSQILQRTEQT